MSGFVLTEYQSRVYGATFYAGLGGISWYEIQTPGFDSFELESFVRVFVSSNLVIADRGRAGASDDRYLIVDHKHIRELSRKLDVDALWILNHLRYSERSDLGGLYLPILAEGIVSIDAKDKVIGLDGIFNSVRFEVEDRGDIVNLTVNDPAVIRGKVWGGSN